ncbi:MAG: hypothetical protein RH942_06495 [Kiloniellaceae bacterium]
MRNAIVFGCLFIVSGCTSDFFSNFAITDNAANPIIEGQQKFAKVDLVAFLDPRQYGRSEAYEGLRNLGAASEKPEGNKFFKEIQDDLLDDPVAASGLDELENAFYGFYDPRYGGADTQTRRRNSVQARLNGASDQECSYFLDQIRKDQTGFNFALGSLTTALGGVGAIVTGAGLARAFSGAAAIASGVKAEGNDANFRQLTAEVIVRGIVAKRTELLESVKARRKAHIGDYTVEDAVADSVRYHSFCNLISGLEHASKQVQLSEDPGLKRTLKLLQSAGIEGAVTFDLEKLSTEGATAGAPTTLAAAVTDGDSVRRVAASSVESIAKLLSGAAASITNLRKKRETLNSDSPVSAGTTAVLAEVDEDMEVLESALGAINTLFDKAIERDKAILIFSTKGEAQKTAEEKIAAGENAGAIAAIAAQVQTLYDDIASRVKANSIKLEAITPTVAPTAPDSDSADSG